MPLAKASQQTMQNFSEKAVASGMSNTLSISVSWSTLIPQQNRDAVVHFFVRWSKFAGLSMDLE